MLLKLESESGESESAMQKIRNRIRIRRFFGRIAIPGMSIKYYTNQIGIEIFQANNFLTKLSVIHVQI